MAGFVYKYLRKRPRTLAEREDGATAVEFALVAPALFLLILGTVELALVVAAQNVMESASFTASRLAKTGTGQANGTQETLILKAMKEGITTSLLKKESITITSKSYGTFSDIGKPEAFVDKVPKNAKYDAGETFTDTNGNGKWDADKGKAGYGAAGEVVVYTMSYPWKFVSPFVGKLFGGATSTVTLSTRAVVKNEPYS